MEQLTSEQLLELNEKIDKINKFHRDLFESTDDKPSLKANIENYEKKISGLVNNAEEKIKTISKIHESTSIDTKGIISIKAELDEVVKEFKDNKQEQSILIEELTSFHQKTLIGSEDDISTKDNIDAFESDINKLRDEVEKKVNEIDGFYNNTLVDEVGEVSTRTVLNSLLDQFKTKKDQLNQDLELIKGRKEEQLELINDLSSFHHKTLIGYKDELSTKDNLQALEIEINKLKTDAENKFLELKGFYNSTLIDEDDLISTKTELNNILEEFANKKKVLIDDAKLIEEKKQTQIELIEELSSFHNEALNGTEENTSIKEQLDNLIEEYYSRNASLAEKEVMFNKFYLEIFKGTDESKSLKDEFNFTLTSIKNNLEESEEELSELKDFHDKIIDSIDASGETKEGLDTIVSKLKDRLHVLIKDAEKKLYAITDSALHNAFAVRAESYTDEFKKLQKFTFYSILGLIIDLVVFGGVQVSLNLAGKPFSYNILIYQFSIAGALLIAIWMFNRNQKMAKKLAEEYHHKASISEAMTGYRTLYSLDHEDEEYQQLFNSIKDQLNINPSKHIDSFLKLKSPQEEVTEIAKELLNPKNLGLLAKQLKPLLDKDK